MDRLTANQFIANSAPGTAIWEYTELYAPDLIPVNLPSNRLTNNVPMFLIKLQPGSSLALGEVVPIQIKAGIYFYRPRMVGTIYVLFILGKCTNDIYEIWINHHSTERDSPLKILTLLGKLSFCLFEDSSTPERIISIPNSLNWQSLLDVVHQLPPWSMEAFDEAKAKCPYSTIELWPAK